MYPYRLIDCDCTEAFKTCLDKVIDDTDGSSEGSREEAAEVRRMFFDVLDMKCSRLREYEICHEYGEWFAECKESTTMGIITVE